MIASSHATNFWHTMFVPTTSRQADSGLSTSVAQLFLTQVEVKIDHLAAEEVREKKFGKH